MLSTSKFFHEVEAGNTFLSYYSGIQALFAVANEDKFVQQKLFENWEQLEYKSGHLGYYDYNNWIGSIIGHAVYYFDTTFKNIIDAVSYGSLVYFFFVYHTVDNHYALEEIYRPQLEKIGVIEKCV